MTAFDIPRDVVLPVEDVDVRLVPGPHPFELANPDAIDANWKAERKARPALFDGQVVLLSSLVHRARKLEGRCHAIRFATFLYWRRERPTASAEHAFAHPALVSRDGALVAIRMGAHTANAGRVYFAAGSFEPSDFPDGQVDVHGNMAREVREETGLEIDGAKRDPIHHAVSTRSGTVIFRRYFLPFNAGELAERIRDFVTVDPAPEIEAPVIIRGLHDQPDGLMPHMVPIVRWHFGSREHVAVGDR